jgi:hypothetical protein
LPTRKLNRNGGKPWCGKRRFYDITSLQIGKSAGTVAAANIAIGYSESATCDVSNISITVTP